MSNLDGLLAAYTRFLSVPWTRDLSGHEKVWFLLYDPAQERRLRLRLPTFEMATREAGHGWKQVDLTDAFSDWMSAHKYREAYFQNPERLSLQLKQGFGPYLVQRMSAALAAEDADSNTVVAVSGVASLFGLAKLSALIESTAALVRGRLLVCFPGSRDDTNYRLLNARDGWNYLAVPIEADGRS